MLIEFRLLCLLSLGCLMLFAAVSSYGGDEADATYDKSDPQMQWWHDSMQTRDERLDWWRDARFGCFIHWGAYSPFGGVWKGEPMPGYAEHLMRHFKLDNTTYEREVVATFNPTQFDADAWVRAIKDAGMRYVVITAKHHDGFAIWDSPSTKYDIIDATPFGRDPIAELREACDRHGLKLGFYYSHAQDWHHPQGTRAAWQFDYPASRRPLWWKVPENRWHIANVHRYFDEKAIPQIQELIAQYDPAIMWFDTAFWAPPEVTIRALEAARKAKPDLIVNSRVLTGGKGNFGDYQSTSDKPAEFYPVEGDWEAIPTTNESYGWHAQDRSHKPAEHFVGLLIKAAARGGNLLMNLGPKGDGTIDPTDLAILREISEWMAVNKESIHGTQQTTLPVQAWGQSTRKGENTIYLHVFDWPSDGRLVVGGLRSDVTAAALLSDPKAALTTQRLDETSWVIDVPAKSPTPPVGVIRLTVSDVNDTDPVRLLQPKHGTNTLHVFDGQLKGKRLRYGKGHSDDDYVENWVELDASVSWKVRLREETELRLVAEVTMPSKPSSGGVFSVELADRARRVTLSNVPGVSREVVLDQFRVPAGDHELKITPITIKTDGELMRLHEVRLIPVAETDQPGDGN